jgi:hypothetical protein
VDRDVCEHMNPKSQHCPRCGKDNPPEVHTCTPKALVLADELERHIGEFETATRASAELRRLYAENERLRSAANRGGHMAVAWELQQADEALLRQALECLEAMNPYPASKEEQRATAITAIKERLA